MSQMKAVRWHGQKDIRVEMVAIPEVKPHQVKIAVKFTGICGSDLHEYLGGPIFIPTEKEHPYSKQKAPIIMGHEFAGEVVEIGADVSSIKVGDKVTVEPILAKNGLLGMYNLDPNLGFVGLSGDGGFAEYCVVDAELVHKLPEGIDCEQGALTEPAAVALYAVRKSKLKAGDTATVFGCGPIGLLVIEALRAAGASIIFAVELSPERQEKAQSLGAIVVDPTKVNTVEFIKAQTNGGTTVSFEVTGVPPVLKQAIEVIENDGECIIVSIWESDASITPNEIVIKEKTVKGIIAYRDVFPAVLELMQKGYFSKDKLVTKKIHIDDIVNEGFEALVKEKNQVKILVSPK
ncbi:butanediol dehydrogenase [Vespertiliibacter pulmonis]|uniref:(R,R)-butanediol dehydrogenase/meso-butanediol dehydrogenase/diacetyl reductase n=1 Tax=Vespertiliibacter pulmonis TaxID=1443036 RepID=A0A3N4VWJ0_9PAST|nr:2,3-butanediol dehydrogenase [Vespertiliibacter pulmonis]QLB20811.1 butanediol dehydrogenase [Vespertiliibacter pulmonis]RPE83461.1 (R,R)-butanediol dehydrogenase/meso-butanediol dehydrogenase/diacetyl reductase [Vespertiliibacter pulmonis]